MLFLPECLGFMGENAEQTLKEAVDTPPIINMEDVASDDDEGQSSCCMTTPFREILSQTITNAEFGNDDDDDDDDHEQPLTPTIASLSSSSSSSTFSIIDELQYIAYKSKLWISGGGVHTKVLANHQSATTSTVNPDTIIGTENKIYNTHVIIDDKGRIQAYYHKIHLFDVSLPDKKVELRESNTTSPGTQLVVCDSPVGKLGLSICYDMRFPEMYVELVQKHGAQVLLMPSAFTVPTGKAHWHALLRGERVSRSILLFLGGIYFAYDIMCNSHSQCKTFFRDILMPRIARAIENQCYVIAAAQVGKHNEKRESYGHSLGERAV